MDATLADLVGEALQHVEEVTPEEVYRLLGVAGHEGWHFVDVREADEFAAAHIPGARLYPRGFLEVRADLSHPKRDEWLADRTRPLVLYCGGGHRSALAAHALARMGFEQVVSLAEGFSGWAARGYPVEP